MTQQITSFRGQYEFLRNFYYAPVEYEGVTYPTIEHAYHAAKALYPLDRDLIRDCETPGRAKKLGRIIAIRPDWEAIKMTVMADLIKDKFAPETDLAQRLVETYPATLIEGNTWGDMVWGAVQDENGAWNGANYLGVMLMAHRNWLREGLHLTDEKDPTPEERVEELEAENAALRAQLHEAYVAVNRARSDAEVLMSGIDDTLNILEDI